MERINAFWFHFEAMMWRKQVESDRTALMFSQGGPGINLMTDGIRKEIASLLHNILLFFFFSLKTIRTRLSWPADFDTKILS